MKKLRTTRACDRCHRGGLKCAPSQQPGSCERCVSFGAVCTYDRPMKRRGPPARSNRPRSRATPKSTLRSASPDWEYCEVADHEAIDQLIDIYYRLVYPMTICFHWPSLLADIRARRYTHDRSFFVLTMAMCAITSARMRDGALVPPLASAVGSTTIPASEVFYRACLDSTPKLVAERADFNFMRTEALLCLLCLQYNDVRGSHAHLHQYLAMSAERGFHNEARWPSDLTEIEKQEWRRLFWQQYHFDVYLAVTFGSLVRQRESQCAVLYPATVIDDEDITETGFSPSQDGGVSFLQAWNFITDLYRILEHVNDRALTRQMRGENPHAAISKLFTQTMMGSGSPSTTEVLSVMKRLYEALPAELRYPRPMTGDIRQDRFGFEAADIVISMTTVKMVLVGSEEHNVAQRCAIAGELIDGLSTIPTSYIQASSTVMMHHLAGVGHLLASVIHAPLSKWTYLQVRSALLAMADLVGGLETALSSAVGIADRLREHVQRIDQYMKDAGKRRTENSAGLSAQATPVARTPRETERRADPQPAIDAGNLDPFIGPEPVYAPAANLAFTPNPSLPPTVPVMSSTFDSVPTGFSPFQLPGELVSDWPLDFGQGDGFILGLGQGQAGSWDGLGWYGTEEPPGPSFQG